MRKFEGKLVAKGLRFAIVVSRYQELVTQRLLEGALDAIRRHDGNEDDVDVYYVPGSFEIPTVAKALAKKGTYDAVICLGAVLRGDTPHFELVASQVARGVAQVGLETGVPTIFGVVSAENLEQALERAGTKRGNRGFDAAVTAIEMANLLKAL